MEIIIICVLLNIISILPEYLLADIKVFDFPFNALISVFMISDTSNTDAFKMESDIFNAFIFSHFNNRGYD